MSMRKQGVLGRSVRVHDPQQQPNLVASVLLACAFSLVLCIAGSKNTRASEPASRSAITPLGNSQLANDSALLNDLVRATRGGAHGSKDPHAALTPDKHIQVALQHKAEGRPGEAFKTLDQAITRYSQHARLLAVRGSIHLERANIAAALQDFEAAINMNPDDAEVLTNRAQAYRHFGRIAEALADLDRAIELKPDLVAAYFNRGSIHYSSEAFQQALADFDACVSIDPHLAGPYFNRASTRYLLDDVDGAIADLERFKQMSGNVEWKQTADELMQKWQNG